MTKPVEDFAAVLSEFISRTAHRFAQNPAAPGLPDAGEMDAYERVKRELAALLATPHDAFERILDCLNSAFVADGSAIHALCCNRVPCNAVLAEHPTVQVDEPLGSAASSRPIPPSRDAGSQVHGGFSVGALGLINGVVESATGRRVAVQWSDDAPSRMLGFVEYHPPAPLGASVPEER